MNVSYRSITRPNAMIEKYKEEVELKYLKKKTLFVNIILMMLMFPVLFVLYKYDKSVLTISIYGVFFILVMGVNIAFYAYEDHFNSLKLAMYITTIAIYVVATSLIIEIQSPSIFTLLFLAYAIVSIYQDKKATLLNNISIFALGLIIVWRYQHIFYTSDTLGAQVIYIYVSLIIFISFLTLASFVLIKRYHYFFHQLALIKETEIRTINILYDLRHKSTKKKFTSSRYYNQLKDFSQDISNKIQIENIFIEKLDIIKSFDKLSDIEILNVFPEYDREDLEEFKRLNLSLKHKMPYLLYKASQVSSETISKKTMYSETENKSLKHTFDSDYTKIIAFCVFYTLLKQDKPYLKAMSDEDISHLLNDTDFRHLIDAKVLDIYMHNKEVFDKIITDAFGKVVK